MNAQPRRAIAAPRRARRAAARQAAGPVEQRRAAEGQAPATAPRRPATPARSTRWPPACCRCASARRPSSRRSAWTPTSATARRCSSARRRRTGDARRRGAASSARCASTAPRSRPPARASPAPIDQVPPMHSALKHEGKALYDYARAGIEVERDRAQRHDPSHRRRRLAGTTAGARRALQQGHLHPHAGRGHRRGARLRRAPGGAAPHRAAAR